VQIEELHMSWPFCLLRRITRDFGFASTRVFLLGLRALSTVQDLPPLFQLPSSFREHLHPLRRVYILESPRTSKHIWALIPNYLLFYRH
jgi:hypothetical protein